MHQKKILFEIIPQGPLEKFFALTEGMTSLEDATVLYELAKSVPDGCIVEVGAYRGQSTVALGRGSIDGQQVPVFTIEPHEIFTGIYGGEFGPSDRGAFYKAMLDSGCYHVVRLLNTSSELIANNWNKEISLLWIDGDHSHEGVNRDYECWQPFLKQNAIVAFDDSTDPGIGPYHLVQRLVSSGEYRLMSTTRKINVLQKQ